MGDRCLLPFSEALLRLLFLFGLLCLFRLDFLFTLFLFLLFTHLENPLLKQCNI